MKVKVDFVDKPSQEYPLTYDDICKRAGVYESIEYPGLFAITIESPGEDYGHIPIFLKDGVLHYEYYNFDSSSRFRIFIKKIVLTLNAD